MRLAGRARLGFYPLPLPAAEGIRRFLAVPDKPCCALDPCVGEGAAFAAITSDKEPGATALSWTPGARSELEPGASR